MTSRPGESLAYTVLGYETGLIDTAQLHLAIVKLGYAQKIPAMKVYTVNSEDFERLSSRFGEQFANFVLLNDVAVEVFRLVGAEYKPLGLVDESDVLNPLPLLGS